MAMYWNAGTTDIPTLADLIVPAWHADLAVARVLRVRFAVKMPMWPVHTWLPDAHVEAPTAGLGHPGRDPAEDGRLRVHPLPHADVPGRRPS